MDISLAIIIALMLAMFTIIRVLIGLGLTKLLLAILEHKITILIPIVLELTFAYLTVYYDACNELRQARFFFVLFFMVLFFETHKLLKK